MSWQSALQCVLEIARAPLEQDESTWAVIGSAASTLQGCQVVPRDIDLLFADPAGVYRLAEFHSELGGIDWLSTPTQPVRAGPRAGIARYLTNR